MRFLRLWNWAFSILIFALGFIPCHAHAYKLEGFRDLTDSSGIQIREYRVSSDLSDKEHLSNIPILMVRIDPNTHSIQLECASTPQGWKSAANWAGSKSLSGAMCASKFDAEGQCLGYMKANADHIISNRAMGHLGGYLALNPNNPRDLAVQIFHIESANLNDIATRYQTVVQMERLLNEHQKPLQWGYQTPHTMAAIGVDTNQHLVLIFSESQITTTQFAGMLTLPELGLNGALYAQGGASCGLCVHLDDGRTISKSGRLTAPASLGMVGSLLNWISPAWVGKNRFPFAIYFEEKDESSDEEKTPVTVPAVQAVTDSFNILDFISSDEVISKFQNLSPDGKAFIEKIVQDKRFLRAADFNDLPLILREQFVRRYNESQFSSPSHNIDFVRNFKNNKVVALVNREVEHLDFEMSEDLIEIEREKKERNNRPAFKAFETENTSGSQAPKIVYNGSGFIYLADFLLGKTQGVNFHGSKGDGQPRYGLWVSPNTTEEKSRADYYAGKTFEYRLDYPAVISFFVPYRYLDAVPNHYEAGLSPTNFEHISNISIKISQLNKTIEAANITELQVKVAHFLDELRTKQEASSAL